MEPRIQYAKTSDGVDIAFATAGDGLPLLMVPNIPYSHVQASWAIFAHIFQPLSERFRLVWYDSRGSGLSDRDAIDYSMDAMIRDADAVIAGAGLTGFAMYAVADGAVPIAIAYAATRPEKVSSLILVDGFVKYSDYHQDPAAIVAEVALRSGDWMVYTETLARLWLGFENQENTAKVAAFMRECAEPEAARSSSSNAEAWDVSALLPRVSARTLVVHNRHNRFLPVQVGQRLAARIPNARFQVIDDMNYEQMPGIITGFLGESDQIAAPRDLPSGTAVILFADIADSTALTEHLGDAAFRAKARELGGSLRALIRESGGTPVEGPTLGDGVLAVFTSAREAIEAAVRCAAAGTDAGLPLHLGLHAGDVTREKDPDGRANVYGGAVNIAARIASASAAGEILVSDIVRGLARTSAGVTFEDRGEHALKGIADSQRIFAVRGREGDT